MLVLRLGAIRFHPSLFLNLKPGGSNDTEFNFEISQPVRPQPPKTAGGLGGVCPSGESGPARGLPTHDGPGPSPSSNLKLRPRPGFRLGLQVLAYLFMPKHGSSHFAGRGNNINSARGPGGPLRGPL